MFKNHVDLIGFIGSDPETRQLENGASMTYFSLATKTTWKNEGGSYDSQTEWHRIVVWGKLGQFAARLAKDAHIEIEGQLRQRKNEKPVLDFPIFPQNVISLGSLRAFTFALPSR